MKSIKMLFTALAVVAVAGGSLAFKASKFSQFYLFHKLSTGVCVEVGPADTNPSGTKYLSAWTTATTPTTTTTSATLCSSTIFADVQP